MSYESVMARKSEIMKSSVGFNYEQYRSGRVGFEYEQMLADTKVSLEEIRRLQSEVAVGSTPLVELKNLTNMVRSYSAQGKGARIFVKDEAANPSGSYKDRRASVSIWAAEKAGFKGVAAATSGNYGAAVASQAARRGLKSIIVQEAFDSKNMAQPEILEKARACEAYGAEVLRLSVGPELFYVFLQILEETGYFNASLYTPYSIRGVETLGVEIVEEIRNREGKDPEVVICTHAGGGNTTGTARGVKIAGAQNTQIIGASVDLSGLHMASDIDFNRKSFTTGHTGFGVPFATWPDRSDVPFNAARPLRYMDRYLLMTQGEVFFTTQALAEMEGLERGPAGNTSLAAAIALAGEMDQDQIIVVQETEYTGAGKHPTAQLALAKEMGIELAFGDPAENVPGKKIILPDHPSRISYREQDLMLLKKSYLKNVHALIEGGTLTDQELKFLSEDLRLESSEILQILHSIKAAQ
jgi:cysteine synthase